MNGGGNSGSGGRGAAGHTWTKGTAATGTWQRAFILE